jgi:phage shock protein PspC (stress-responsive transcriptional regulator)
MKGAVLTVDLAANTALISGDDGVRYPFGSADWKEKQPPVKGQRVDFVVADDGRAAEVYVDVGASAATTTVQGWPVGLDERYRGLYCSSDEKMLLGLCAGLAHKYDIQVGVVRAIVFLFAMFVLWIPYLVGFFLPKLPTKGVPHPG